jgi:hydroxyacylglutathione hydrolase
VISVGFRTEYTAALRQHVLGEDETTLRQGYELGRSAVAGGVSALDVAAIHHQALESSLETAQDRRTSEIVGAAAGFFQEVLSAFEMVHRGYGEAAAAAAAERHRAAMLRRLSSFLTDASLSARHGDAVSEVLHLVAEHARELTGATSAIASWRDGDDQVRATSSDHESTAADETDLLRHVEREGLTPTHLLTTHSHPDHVAGDDELVQRYGVEIVKGSLELEGLRIAALETPGHADDHLAYVVNDIVAFTADILFRDAVGGGPDVEPIRRSVMDVLMALPPEVRVLPGHTEETTIGREWEENPFITYWRGAAEPIDEAVRVGGQDATLVVWSPDYDGKGKALVRFADGREAIVGGSRVER